jgi:hypothetical protein
MTANRFWQQGVTSGRSMDKMKRDNSEFNLAENGL